MQELQEIASALDRLFAVFALSSAIAAYHVTRIHLGVTNTWYKNRFFWYGFFGNFPALLGICAHVMFSLQRGERFIRSEEMPATAEAAAPKS